MEKGDGKRQATDEPAASSHNDKKKKVSESKSTTTPTSEQKGDNIFDHIRVHSQDISQRFLKQARGRNVVPLTLVFVFCESELTKSAALLNHLPHLIGELNARRSKKVKLVRLPEGARNALNELWAFGSFDVFAVQACVATPTASFWKLIISAAKHMRNGAAMECSELRTTGKTHLRKWPRILSILEFALSVSAMNVLSVAH